MKKLMCLLASVLLLGACASNRLSEDERASIVDQYIITEKLEHRSTVSAFDMDSWTSLSDRYLILRSSPFRSYLVKLANRCHDLDFSPTIVINTRMANNLSEGFDSVYTPGNQTFKCYISRIYPLTKEQNKALIAAVNPSDDEKKIEKPAEETTPKVETLVPTVTE